MLNYSVAELRILFLYPFVVSLCLQKYIYAFKKQIKMKESFDKIYFSITVSYICINYCY